MVTIATSLIFAFGVPSMFQPDSTPPPEKDPSVYEKEFVVAFSDHDKVGTLNVDIKRGSILVTGYDGDEVVVQLRSPNYSPAGQTSTDGFKELRGNTLDFDIEKSSEQIKVDGNSYQYITNLEIKVPRKTNLILDSYQDGKIHVENVEGTFKLRSQNNDISAEKVSGSGRLWSYNGNLSADFKKVTKGQDIELETYNGSIDLTLPADIKANAKYRSGSGRVFTDFEVALAEDRILAAGDSKVEFDEFNRGTINGGGPALTLETEKGDIRLKRRMNISIR